MNSLVKPSKDIKEKTSRVRRHLDAMQRAGEIYRAGMIRLESDYAERVRVATEILTEGETPAEHSTSEQPQQPEQQQAAS